MPTYVVFPEQSTFSSLLAFKNSEI